SIEIKSFKISKKRGLIATAVTSLIDGTRTIRMEDLEKENAELKNQSETIVQKNASRTNPISSVLLPLDHPLVQLITEQLQHAPKRFNYAEQNNMQQATLVVQKQRAIDNEILKQQAAELAKIKEAAIRCGFGEAFFEDFQATPIIQERYTRLVAAINGVDTLPINLASDEEAIKVRQYIKARLINEREILLSHINAATERFNALPLNDYSIKERLAKIENAILTVDNLGWFGTTWFAPTVAPEVRTHYLALLDLQKREAEATITALSKPLEDLAGGKCDLVMDYLKENPGKAALLLPEVLHYKNSFSFYQSWPESLLKLEQFLLEILSNNKLTESVPSVTMHLSQAPVTPTLMFGGVPKPNASAKIPDKQEAKDVYDYKAEEELQLANALILSEAEAIAASKDKIGPKTIPGWELTDVSEIGNCFYEAIALQLQKNDFPIAERFPQTRPENGGTALTDILRRRSTPEFRDRDWAGEEEILAIAREFNIVIAIVDTRSEEPVFQYHLVDWKGKPNRTRDKNELPNGQPVIELAYTGNHYLSVTSKPKSPASPKR
ncbi:MAG TPA: hypothetical protein VGU44_03740, partial [Gammaproteobacteria bacterium]|nr:hypothetical protein [Gammaproteobacteria bacterium]